MFIRLFSVAILLFYTSIGSAQRPFNDKMWLFEAISDVRIYAMIQDERGYMWLGTDIGLCKFTGQGLFPIYDTTHKAITSLYNDKGTIYAGYENGALGRVYGDTMKLIKVLNAAPKTAIRDLIASSKGVFLCTEQGLYIVMNNVGVLVNKQDGLASNSVFSIVRGSNGNVLVGTDNGINELTIKDHKISIAKYDLNIVLPDKSVKILKKLPNDIYAWVGTNNGVAFIELSHSLRKIASYKKIW
jgi:ligand-binding sensor domain-containing protein